MASAAELALAVARRDRASPDAPPPPSALNPFLRFRPPLSSRARDAVLGVLDSDPEFRSRVASALVELDPDADGADDSDVSEGSAARRERATRLYLLRPQGWSEELATLSSQLLAGRAKAADEREDADARRRVSQLEETVARLRAERDDARAQVESLRADLAAERRRSGEAEAAATDARAERDRAESERDRAVGDLKRSREAAQRRLEAQRRAEARLAELERADLPAGGVDPSEAAEALDRLEGLLAGLGPALDDLRTVLEPAGQPNGEKARTSGQPGSIGEERTGTQPERGSEAGERSRPTPSGAEAGTPAAPSGAAVTRRVPARLERGATEDDPDGVDQLMRLDRVLVLVDGYNVSMSAWPGLDGPTQRERLVDLLAGARARTGADVHVVFDGGDVGVRPAVGAPLPIRVHFSPAGVEADDVLLDFASSAPSERPVVVVSDDRRVRDGARRAGANVVGVSALLRWAGLR